MRTMARASLLLGVGLMLVMVSTGLAANRASSTYKFAVLGPLTGDAAVFGLDQKLGVQLAVDQINAAGGINGHKVTLEFLDTQCDATQGATKAARVASDSSIFAVIGDVCSSATLAELPILARSHVTQMSADSTSPKITDVVKQGHYTTFARNIPTDKQMAASMVKLAVKILGKKRIGVIYASDDFAQPALAYEKSDVSHYPAASIVDTETYTPSTTKDFTAQWTTLKNANPDVVLFDGYYGDAGTAVSQLGRVGFPSIPMIYTAGVDVTDFMKLAGRSSENAYVFSYYSASNPSAANKKFVSSFKKKYPAAASRGAYPYAVWAYELPFIYKNAIERGATRSNLAQFVKKLTYSGPTGVTRFNSNGDVIGKSTVVLRVKHGQFVFDPKLTSAVR